MALRQFSVICFANTSKGYQKNNLLIGNIHWTSCDRFNITRLIRDENNMNNVYGSKCAEGSEMRDPSVNSLSLNHLTCM